MKVRSLSPGLLLFAALNLPGATDPGQQVVSAYALATKGMYAEAATAWDELTRTAPAAWRREVQFGRASTLLNLQPRTTGNLEEARRLLGEVTASNADDELGMAAAYLLIRMDQFHEPEKGALESIAASLRALHDRRPEHPLAQLALLKHVTIRLWLPQDLAQKRAELTALEPLAGRFTDPRLKTLFHVQMSEAFLIQLGDRDSALRHERARDGRLLLKEDTSADVLLRTAELERASGDHPAARNTYRRYLQQFPLNPQSWIVQQRLDELSAPAAAP